MAYILALIHKSEIKVLKIPRNAAKQAKMHKLHTKEQWLTLVTVTLDHTILLDKPLYYGIRGTAYNLLRSYLANREQFVELNDTASKTLPVVTGVPQGSILGPLLFLIYINDFPLSSNFFKFIMYADDTTLYSQFDNARIANHDIELEINNELTNINDWLKINKLALTD